jgi:hypothetical protein
MPRRTQAQLGPAAAAGAAPSPLRPRGPARAAPQRRPRPSSSFLPLSTFGLVLAAALPLVVLSLAPRAAHAHAVLIDPPSRPWLDYLLNYNYNPHAVNAGGTAAVSKNQTLVWPAASRSGICGDALGEKKWDAPGPVRKTYKAGDAIDADVLFAQNHLGRWRFRLCPLDATSEGQCRDLERADGKGKAVDLVWTPGWAGVTSGFVPPLAVDGFSTYQLKPIGKAEGCAAWACDQFKGMYVYRSEWRLPTAAQLAGLKCDKGCKLQFAYLTASSCWPACLPDQKGCKPKPVNYPYCGTPGASYPEEFWGCADVAVV